MTSYYVLLANRLAGAPEAVRPLLPSRFEVAESPAVASGDEQMARVREQETSPETIEVQAETEAPVAQPAPESRRQKPRRRALSGAVGGESTTPAEVPVDEGSVAPRSLSRRQQRLSAPLPGQFAPEEPELSGSQQLVASPKPVSHPANAGSQEIRPLEVDLQTVAPAPSRATAVPHHDAPTAGPIVSPAPLKPVATLVPAAELEFREPLTAMRRSGAPGAVDKAVPAHRDSLRNSPGHQEPLRSPMLAPIQITIGRIEVQAVLPPPAAPATVAAPRRATAPMLSLEAYLSRRNGTQP